MKFNKTKKTSKKFCRKFNKKCNKKSSRKIMKGGLYELSFLFVIIVVYIFYILWCKLHKNISNYIYDKPSHFERALEYVLNGSMVHSKENYPEEEEQEVSEMDDDEEASAAARQEAADKIAELRAKAMAEVTEMAEVEAATPQLWVAKDRPEMYNNKLIIRQSAGRDQYGGAEVNDIKKAIQVVEMCPFDKVIAKDVAKRVEQLDETVETRTFINTLTEEILGKDYLSKSYKKPEVFRLIKDFLIKLSPQDQQKIRENIKKLFLIDKKPPKYHLKFREHFFKLYYLKFHEPFLKFQDRMKDIKDRIKKGLKIPKTIRRGGKKQKQGKRPTKRR